MATQMWRSRLTRRIGPSREVGGANAPWAVPLPIPHNPGPFALLLATTGSATEGAGLMTVACGNGIGLESKRVEATRRGPTAPIQ